MLLAFDIDHKDTDTSGSKVLCEIPLSSQSNTSVAHACVHAINRFL